MWAVGLDCSQLWFQSEEVLVILWGLPLTLIHHQFNCYFSENSKNSQAEANMMSSNDLFCPNNSAEQKDTEFIRNTLNTCVIMKMAAD